MTPKEKATQLRNKYMALLETDDYTIPNQCAIIAVDEIIISEPLSPSDTTNYHLAYRQSVNFWLNVKKELEK